MLMAPSVRTILVPIDFSPLSVCAFRFALQLAGRDGAYIRLLHVVDHSSPHSTSSTGEILHGPMDDLHMLRMIEKTTCQLANLARANTNPAVDVQHVVFVGNPAELILETIRDHRMDLVVIGASRANWLNRLLIGTTAEKVVQNAACPVITLKCAIENIGQLHRIVFAFDPGEDQTRVVAALKKLQVLLGARLHVLLVNTPHAFRPGRESNDLLHQFAQAHGLDNYETHVYAHRHPEEGLFEFAREINAGILAFATHHQHRLLRVLSARSQQNMINHAPKPVWTFNPAMAAARPEAGAGDYDCEL